MISATLIPRYKIYTIFLAVSLAPTGGIVALNVASQIDGLIGGLASYAYNRDFSLGQFGAIQLYNFNDILARWSSNNGGKEYAAKFSTPGDLVEEDFETYQQARNYLESLGILFSNRSPSPRMTPAFIWPSTFDPLASPN
jgi:hypothetical protein